MPLLEVTPPSITDWISALGTLAGVPLAILGFIFLFVKDKNKEKQLSSLERLANSQDELIRKMQMQVDQLYTQTIQFQYQSNLMLDHNKLIEKQIEIQTEANLNTMSLEEKKMAFEKQKRLVEIKPHFFVMDGNREGYTFKLSMVNQGHEAHNIDVRIVNSLDMTNARLDTHFVRNNDYLNITFDVREIKQAKEYLLGIELNYTDSDRNAYYQYIDLENKHYTLTVPELSL